MARVLGIDTLFVGGDSTYTGGWEQLRLYGQGGALDDLDKQQSMLLVDSVRDELETCWSEARVGNAWSICSRRSCKKLVGDVLSELFGELPEPLDRTHLGVVRSAQNPRVACVR